MKCEKISIEAKSGDYSLIADDYGVTIVKRVGDFIHHVGTYIKDKIGSDYSIGYDKGLRDAAIIYEGGLSLSEDMRSDLGISTKKQEPETFDFYEAMRRVYEGKKVIPVDWISCGNRENYIFLDGNSIKIQLDLSVEILNFEKNYFKRTYKEVKEQPKTFGWDEAYRLMKIGKSVTRMKWNGIENEFGDKIDRHLIISLGWENIIRRERRKGCFVESDCAMSLDGLSATDWYVYNE